MQEKCSNNNCPVVRALEMIGGKYKALILWRLLEDTLRFGQLRKMIPQATAKMLTQQLRELEEDGLIVRTVYPVVPPKVEYSLSDLGKSAKPVLSAIYHWGEMHMEENGVTVNCFMKEEI